MRLVVLGMGGIVGDGAVFGAVLLREQGARAMISVGEALWMETGVEILCLINCLVVGVGVMVLSLPSLS